MTTYLSPRSELARACGRLGVVLLSFALVACSSDEDAPSPISERGYRGGLVAVSDPLAAKAGAAVLEQGGNAIDAAAAIQFALNVVEPQSSGLGGGGFMVVYLAESGQTVMLDGRERAPAAATPDMFGDLSFADASTSGIAVGVPGTLRLIDTALEKWGTLDLAETLAPAIALAEDGFPVSVLLASDIVDTTDRGFEITNLQPEMAEVFRPEGNPLSEGALLKQPDLGKTFRLIAEQGPEVFYQGEIATAIVEAQTRSGTSAAAGGEVHAGAAGTMTEDDLAAYEVAERQPLSLDYRGYTVKTMPPPSGGGIAVLQQLAMLEQFPLGNVDEGFGFGAEKTLNVMIDAERLSFADRNFWGGDADFAAVPVEGLLAPEYLASRAELLAADSALSPSQIVPGDPLAYEGERLIGASDEPQEGSHTTHYVVVDEAGNIVSFTTTVESLFGSGILVPGYGFLLNNELTDFNFPPAADAATGNIGANDVAPGKRPRSSMAPSLVFDGERPFLALGSAGGAKIINAVVQLISNVVDHGMGAQQAIDAARISAGASGSVFCETGPFRPTGFTPSPAFSPSVVAAVNALRDPSIGMPPCSGQDANGANLSAQLALFDDESDRVFGGADRRRGGVVIGLE